MHYSVSIRGLIGSERTTALSVVQAILVLIVKQASEQCSWSISYAQFEVPYMLYTGVRFKASTHCVMASAIVKLYCTYTP